MFAEIVYGWNMCRYLDQLAMAAKYHTEVYCRQTLIGGNYGLLNKTTFVPNPDYYRWNRSTLIWITCYFFYFFFNFVIRYMTNMFHWASYSALLWHRLMGTGVLSVERRSVGPHLRTYAHCSKGKVSSFVFLNIFI